MTLRKKFTCNGASKLILVFGQIKSTWQRNLSKLTLADSNVTRVNNFKIGIYLNCFDFIFCQGNCNYAIHFPFGFKVS